ncbi:ubiquinone/menaquinone biosynthesis C-methylase UbiE [Natronocella acetinitrilica]|uniref:Ubiquinone/menaquinone biosynthesis C-methylase UbiE n=2 Tax=Natronocella acetinitrilica TaxID=414046 RepID=A0AAE3G526_9GAMM|nr:ubiquinone/menaquinone biosynthesis C-methylase UbiE [Natronocella acetinitrilica]
MDNMVLQPPDVETASEGYASRFQGSAGQYLLRAQERALLSLLPHGSPLTVLDVGGGHGQTASVLAREGHAVTVLGSTPEAFHRLRALGLQHRCRLATGDLLSTPFADASFDVVVSVRLISHMEDWQRLIAEMCRVARGAVIIDYPRTVGVNALTPVLFGVKQRFEGNTRNYRSFSDEQIAEAFDRNGHHVAARVGQFVLPMVVHRFTGAGPVSRGLESLAARVGLRDRFGSPVMIRADRRTAGQRSASEEE